MNGINSAGVLPQSDALLVKETHFRHLELELEATIVGKGGLASKMVCCWLAFIHKASLVKHFPSGGIRENLNHQIY